MTCYPWKNIKKSYKDNELKKSAPIWNDKLELPDGSNLISDIQNYFEYRLKKWGKTVNASIRIYINQRETNWNWNK